MTIISILFWLAGAKKNKKGLCPIYIRITIGGERTDISTGIMVKPEDWDGVNKRVIGKSDIVELQNKRLVHFESEINRIHLYLEQNRQIISGNSVKRLLFQGDMPSFVDLYQKMIKDKSLLVGTEFTARTIEIYQTNFNHCKDFLRQTNQFHITIGEVRTKFIKEYEMYLKTVVKASHNYCMRILRNVKQVIRYAIAYEYIEHSPLIAVQFKMNKSRKKREYLTALELDLIRKYHFQNPTFAKIQDLFLFQCATGFSYADLISFSFGEHTIDYEGKRFIEKQRKKREYGTSAILPLFDEAVSILEKYNYQLPIISNQTYNRLLKEMGKVVNVEKRFTTHIARRTAAMYWLNDKSFPLDLVAQMLGHESEKTTKEYYAHILLKTIAEKFK